MKKVMLLTLSIFLSLTVFAPTNSFDLMRFVKPLPEKKEDKILLAIMETESRYNSKAYNKKENAAGILQIRPVMLNHINKILEQRGDTLRFELKDRYDSAKSVAMYYIVQEYDNPQYDPMLAARLWNGGTTRYKEMSHQYWLKIKDKIEYDTRERDQRTNMVQ